MINIFLGHFWIFELTHIVLELGHLNPINILNAPIQIQYELIQKSKNDLEICLSFLAEVFTFIKNHEHF